MKNIVIISDIHLCKTIHNEQRRLCDFVHHHAKHREQATPWRLVINGDLFDFDYQTTIFAERGPEDASLRLFDEIADEYQDLLAAFAEFLDEGNEIVLIPGNHDVDLMWPKVREALQGRIGAHLRDPDSLRRLSYRDWFYYEPGRIYIEHGHQYEIDTSVAGILDPFEAGWGLRPSLATHWICDYCPNIPELTYQVDATQSLLTYIPLLIRRYGLRAPELWFKYLGFALRTLRRAGAHHGRPSARHIRERAAVSQETGLPEPTLVAIENLSLQPRMASRWAVVARLHVVPAFLLPVAFCLGALAALRGSSAFLTAALCTLGVVVLSNLVISSRFAHEKEGQQRDAAAELQRLLGVPLVCLGHFHVPTDEPAGEGRYLNSGTWSEARRPNSYIRVLDSRAEICEWRPSSVEECEPAVGLKSQRPGV